MKRIICVILASLIVLSCSVNAKAEGIDEETEENVMLTEVLNNTNQEEIAQLIEEGRFNKSMDGVNLEEKSLLLSYFLPVGHLKENDWNTAKDKAKEIDGGVRWVVLGEGSFVMKYYSSNGEYGVSTRYNELPTYAQDILSGQQRQSILGQEVLITNLTAFRCPTVNEEVEVVYETDHGVFVRYYESENAQAVEYRWEDYIPLAIAYREYRQSYEFNYSPDGEPLYGGNVSFLEYCQNPSKYLVIPAPQQPDEQQEEPPEEKKNYTAAIVIASALGVVALTAGAIIILRRKKR